MTDSVKSGNDVPLETSVPQAGAPLESILCTEELQRRPSRPPDYEKENQALVKLVSALADSPGTIFQTLAQTILEITQCDSAGLSLLTRDGKTPHVDGQRFYWPAICGMWNPHVGGGTPRNFGPCGDVLDQNRTLLFTHFERRYPYLMPVSPAAEECLLVPFYVDGRAVGTIWGIMHSDRRKFDGEDDRVMDSLGKFASSAYQAWMHIEDLKVQVAQREKAEAEVRKLASGLEAKIRRLVDANVVGIVMWNLEGAITEANEAFLRLVKCNRDDLTSGGVRWTDLTPAEWRECDYWAIAQLNATGIFQPYEKEFSRKDGTRVPVLLGGALFEGSENEGVAFVLDLAEQKQTERALRRSKAFLVEGQRLGQIGSFSWRLATDEITWSDQLYRIYEVETGVPVTLDLIRTRVHPEDVTLYEKMIEQARNGGEDFEWQYRLLMPNDSIKYLQAVAHAIRDENGQLEYIAAIQDVTERHLAEEALNQTRFELAHVARVMSLGTLTASISHEIRQPLAAAITDAKTCSRWLNREKPDVGEAQEANARLVKALTRASEIIARISSLFKKESPKRELVDVNEVVQEITTLLRGEARAHSISVQHDLAGDLPRIVADRVQLQQVLMNLMLNAIEAMKGWSTSGALRIASGREEGGQVLISVSDTGVGLPPEQTEQVFDAFFTSKPQGTGMGLTISRSIIESHGGRLWATSHSGPGATFQFTLPVEDIRQEAA
jgi:PAS domain S-box-containing protein